MAQTRMPFQQLPMYQRMACVTSEVDHAEKFSFMPIISLQRIDCLAEWPMLR